MAEGMQRRLAAILAADVVGYSKLMGEDEAGTHERLKAHRKDFLEPLISEHEGRVVKLTGDGALVEFPSAVQAVLCAAAMQRGMALRNADEPTERRIDFRIGINLGDIIFDEGDIYGDGVNIAARLEALAEPGGICLARNIHNQVKGKVDLAFAAMGSHQVKNIAEPVEVWRVVLDGVPAPRAKVASATRPTYGRKLVAAAAAVLLLAGVAAAASWWAQPPAHTARMKPAIAVLPFDNMGGDPATGRLADGITEDIVTDLAHFRDLDVIARNSTFVYKGKPVDIRQVGKDLNVSYVLEGSIQREPDRVRVTAQLIEADDGAHVWSDRWDRPVQDIFLVQTEIAERVAAAIGGGLTLSGISRNEIQRAKRRPPADLGAFDLYALALEQKALNNETATWTGKGYLDQAIALDPEFARAYAVRAWFHFFTMWYGVEAATALKFMNADAEKAVALDAQDAEAIATLSYARMMIGNYSEAEARMREALAMSPANVHVLVLAASALAYLGKAEEGAEIADHALRLDPRMTPANMNAVKDAYYFAERYEDNIAAINRMPEESRARDTWLLLAASYQRVGKTAEAAAAKAKFRPEYPDGSAERMLNEDFPVPNQREQDLIIQAYKVLDLPICMSSAQSAELTGTKRLPDCDAERAREAAPKS